MSDKPLVIRKVNAALNKLTDRNYASVSSTVASCMPQIQRADLVKLVLEQSIKQSCYVHVFVRLAKDVISGALCPRPADRADCDAEVVADDDGESACTIAAFCDEFFQRSFQTDPGSMLLLPDGPPPSNKQDAAHDYDRFCEHVKAKSKLVGKARTVLHLLLNNMVRGRGASDYMQCMLLAIGETRELFAPMESQQAASALVSNASMSPRDQMLDVLYDLTLEFRTIVGKHAVPDAAIDAWPPHLTATFTSLLDTCNIPKLRFKLMDILNL